MKREKNGNILTRGTRTALRALTFALSLPGRIAAAPVKLYRKYVSPNKGAPSCRYRPTCSEYALGALSEWGLICGGALSLWRVLRCNPFSRGGDDPVPQNPVKRRITDFIRGGQNDSRSAGETTETERE